jgi:hypothetical protein
MTLPEGLYDLLLTESLVSRLGQDAADVRELNSDSAEVLAVALARQLGAILDDLSDDGADATRRQLELVNALLVTLRERLRENQGLVSTVEIIDLVAPPLRLLKGVQRDGQFPLSPEVGLAAPWLFTAGKGSPSLLKEIR